MWIRLVQQVMFAWHSNCAWWAQPKYMKPTNMSSKHPIYETVRTVRTSQSHTVHTEAPAGYISLPHSVRGDRGSARLKVHSPGLMQVYSLANKHYHHDFLCRPSTQQQPHYDYSAISTTAKIKNNLIHSYSTIWFIYDSKNCKYIPNRL